MKPSNLHDILNHATEETLNDNGFLLDSFLDLSAKRGLTLYDAQEAAILEILEGKNVILNTPTGSGKSLVAMMLHYQAFAQGRRSVYTCPIKALVNEKWMALCREFGPENVGLSTGDATVNRDAPILCCTAEILANIALSEGADCQVRDVVMDEFHYYSDRERGVAWQVPLLIMRNTRFLLMSATLGETKFFERALGEINSRDTVTVKSEERPVPLSFSYSINALSDTVQQLCSQGQVPVYVVHFTQAEAVRNAQGFTSLDICTSAEKAALGRALQGFRFSSPFGPDIKRWLRQGIGLHHAGLLPKYRILVEKLSQQGLVKVICGTDTLGVGINVPIRTVLFTQLCKYSGDKTAILSVRDFHQIAGRAGRKGFDDHGYVVAQAPEHIIENSKLAAKSTKTGKKFVKRKPPERGYVPWDESTFQRLIESVPERLVSRFQVSHGMLLNVLSRKDDGCRAMRDLIDDCHDSEREKAAHRTRSFQLFRALVERGIVDILRPEVSTESSDQPVSKKARIRVNVALQENFSMDQELSLYLLDTLPLLEVDSTEYHLNVLTLVESILENPDQVLRRQLDRLKTDKVAALKSQGVEYDQRMEQLEAMEYPKPLREFIYGTFNAFTDKHPWVGTECIRPKSIAREMLEGFFTFSSYVKLYGLERSEGLLLRHLNSVYKVLINTLPQAAKTEEVRAMELFFCDLLRRVDSSLLDEWELLQNPDYRPADESEPLPPGAKEHAEALARDITLDPAIFLKLVHTRILTFLGSLSRNDCSSALESLTEGIDEVGTAFAGYENRTLQKQDSAESVTEWSAQGLQEAYANYRTGHGTFRLDPEGRALKHTTTENDHENSGFLFVKQRLQDYQEVNDTSLVFAIDLTVSKDMGIPILKLIGWEVD